MAAPSDVGALLCSAGQAARIPEEVAPLSRPSVAAGLRSVGAAGHRVWGWFAVGAEGWLGVARLLTAEAGGGAGAGTAAGDGVAQALPGAWRGAAAGGTATSSGSAGQWSRGSAARRVHWSPRVVERSDRQLGLLGEQMLSHVMPHYSRSRPDPIDLA